MLFCPRLIKTSRRGKIIGREVASARCIETKSNAWKTKHQVLWWLLMCHYYVRKCYLHHLGKSLSLKRVISDLLLNIAKMCLECCGRLLFLDSQKCSMSVLWLFIGWLKPKAAISNGCNSWKMPIWPTIGQAKMCFRSGGIFYCKQTAEN